MFPFHFTSDDENDLAAPIIKFARRGFPLTKRRVMSLAYSYAELNGRKCFSKLTQQAGHYWLNQGFLKQHPELRVKKGHNLSFNHAMCANRPTINKWFDQYEVLLQESKIESPMYMWNCNESGIQDVPKEKDVLGITRQKTNNVTSKEQGETSTILMFVNSVGVAFPPIVIHKGRKV